MTEDVVLIPTLNQKIVVLLTCKQGLSLLKSEDWEKDLLSLLPSVLGTFSHLSILAAF